MGKLTNAFKTTLTEQHFMGGDVLCVASEYTLIGRHELQAGEGLALGFSGFGGLANAAGRAFMKIMDNASTPATVEGRIRVNIENPKKRIERTLWEGECSRLRIGEDTVSEREPLPFIPEVIGEDWYMTVEIMPEAEVTVSKANSTVELDCTAYDVV